MSHTRKRRAKSTSHSKRIKKGVFSTFKLVDPVCQSLLFVFFLYDVSADVKFQYRPVLLTLLGLQMASAIINLFLSNSKLLQRQRGYALLCLMVFIPVFIYADKAHRPPVQGEGPTLLQFILIAIAMVLSFWYIYICYKEFRSMFGAVNTGNERSR